MPRKTAPSSALRWTPEHLNDWLKERPEGANASAKKVLDDLGIAAAAPKEEAGPKKRRGVDAKPILDSLKAPVTTVAWCQAPDRLTLWFDGVRLFSLNELFSIMQFRMHEAFKYKKAWRLLIKKSLARFPASQRPRFDGPTRVELFRQAQGGLDRDSSYVVFKYVLDSLVREGVLADDNRAVVVELKEWFAEGPPAVGVRLVALPDWVEPPVPVPLTDWLRDGVVPSGSNPLGEWWAERA